MKNKLVIYYSRDGNTQRVSQFIKDYYGCPGKKIEDTRNRSGLWGFLVAGKDALFKRDTDIKVSNLELDHYESIFLGGPVWAGRIPPAVRTFLKEYDLSEKKLVLFCTMGSSNYAMFFEDIKEIVPECEVDVTFAIRSKNISPDRVQNELENLDLSG